LASSVLTGASARRQRRTPIEMPPSTQYSEGGTPLDQPDNSNYRSAFELMTISRTGRIILRND
jgi:hypothetical protein